MKNNKSEIIVKYLAFLEQRHFFQNLLYNDILERRLSDIGTFSLPFVCCVHSYVLKPMLIVINN